jgi:hypothetical protein
MSRQVIPVYIEEYFKKKVYTYSDEKEKLIAYNMDTHEQTKYKDIEEFLKESSKNPNVIKNIKFI